MEAVAPTTIDRTRLLPRSGIGVDAPWLVIAPPGNPIIRLDARLLDRVELIGRSATGPLIWSGLATAGVAAAALTWLPGGPFACAGLAYLAPERFCAARTCRSPADACSRRRWACSSSRPRSAPPAARTSRSCPSASPTTRRGAATPRGDDARADRGSRRGRPGVRASPRARRRGRHV